MGDKNEVILDVNSISSTFDHRLSSASVEKVEVKKKSLPERIPAFGLLMALLGTVCASLVAVIVKLLTKVHSIQILVIRCIILLIFYGSTTVIMRYNFFGERGHRLDLLMRCTSGTIALICIFMALRMLPIADASTIHLASPVFVTILAFFMLKEAITLLQIITGVITLSGVVIIAKPEFIFGAEKESVHEQRLMGTMLSIVATFAGSFSMIKLSKLKQTPTPVIVMWYSSTVIVSGFVVLIILNKLIWPIGFYTWLLLSATGLCGIADQFFGTTAFKYESPGPISVTRTFNIVLSFIWEVTILSEEIEWTSLLGAAIISICVVILGLVKWRTDTRGTNDFRFVTKLLEILNLKIFKFNTEDPVKN